MDPVWFKGIMLKLPEVLDCILSMAAGQVADGAAMVYVLYSYSTEYIGKIVGIRKTGRAGFCARIIEHFRCLRRPALVDGKKHRY